jgi:hypothetical protein
VPLAILHTADETKAAGKLNQWIEIPAKPTAVASRYEATTMVFAVDEATPTEIRSWSYQVFVVVELFIGHAPRNPKHA